MSCQDEPRATISEYREFRPPEHLAGSVLCTWTQVTALAPRSQLVLPDCCVDVLLMNGVPMVAGPWTRPYTADLPAGTTIVGVRCRPGFASQMLGFPASELLNLTIPLSDVWQRSGDASFARAAEAAMLREQMTALEAAVEARIAGAAPSDAGTEAAIRWIARHPQGRVRELSAQIGLSARQVQRRFSDAVGYGPRMFRSVLRFQRLLHLASGSSTRSSLAQLAAEAGYADQAHMTREVQRFSGRPPTALLARSQSTLKLSNLV